MDNFKEQEENKPYNFLEKYINDRSYEYLRNNAETASLEYEEIKLDPNIYTCPIEEEAPIEPERLKYIEEMTGKKYNAEDGFVRVRIYCPHPKHGYQTVLVSRILAAEHGGYTYCPICLHEKIDKIDNDRFLRMEQIKKDLKERQSSFNKQTVRKSFN